MILNVGQRILASFAVIIALTVGLAAYQQANVGEMRDLASEIVESDFKILNLLRRISESQETMRIHTEQAKAFAFGQAGGVATGDSQAAQGQWVLAQKRALETIDRLLAFLEARRQLTANSDRLLLYSELQDVIPEQRRLLVEISSVVQTEFDLINREKLSELRPQDDVLEQLRAKFSDTTNRSADIAARLSTVAELAIDARHEAVLTASLIALSVVLAIGVAAGWLLYNSINRPVATFMAFVERVGKGDLSQRVSNLGRDEFGRLGQYLNDMVDGLAGATQQSRDATAQLNSAMAELQASSKQQAASTSEQSAAIQQITATLDEIAQSGAQISDRAKTVATAAEATSAGSVISIEAVVEASRAMSAIGAQAQAVATNIVALTEKAQSIGEIIAGVNDIAERSNLLALNAAIEAAAAGESGQSFAVVADEMKSLADQAKDSTLQVRGILSDIQKGISASVMQTEEAVKRAEDGQQKTVQAEETIKALVESIESSIAAFQQIVAATNQQQIGVEQAAQSIQDIRISSEQMAAGIRGLEQASANLGALGEQLRRSIERYAV